MYNMFLPVSMGYIPSGIVFGSISYILGLKFYYVLGLSAFVYSGAVQSAFLGFWSTGLEIPGILLTAFLLNLRHSFYGPHLERKIGGLSKIAIFAIAPFLTDEVYGLAISAGSITGSKVMKLAMWAYLNWFFASAAGFLLFSHISTKYLADLTIALSALFLGLFVPNVKGKDTAIVAITSIAIAAIFRLSGVSAYYYIVAIFAGVIAGVAFSMAGKVKTHD
jgi:predicted branched-subunit amino acid permease